MSSKQKKEEKENIFEYKVITIGDSKVGKTSIIKRFIDNKFYENTLPTLGIFNSQKKITLKNGEEIILKLVDTAGQERYSSLTKHYFRNAHAVLFVFSLDCTDSFNNLVKWINLFNEENPNQKKIVLYLIGNKKDLEKEVDEDKISFFLEDNQQFCYKETSAKEEDNHINELFEEIGEKVYEINKNFQKSDGRRLRLAGVKEKKNNCGLSKCLM